MHLHLYHAYKCMIQQANSSVAKKKKEKKKDRTTGKDMIRADEGYLLVEMVNTLSL